MSTLQVTSIKSHSSGAPVFQNTSGTEKGQLAKAWINYNGTGTVSIRDSFNVSSLTDNGEGLYTITFTNAMSNDDYSRTCCAGENANTGGNRVAGLRLPATGSFNLFTCNTGGSASDTPDTCVAALGDLA